MRAVLCVRDGGPGELEIGATPAPRAAAGEVVIDVRAAAVNYADTLVIAGKYQERHPHPFVPGFECAGTVSAIGAAVNGIAPGDRVFAIHGYGGYAERIAVDARHVYPMPEGMSHEEAAGFAGVFGTAYVALAHRARLRAGETLLVTGASGGVGYAAVQLGKALGARVIAAAGGAEKCAFAAEQGADHVIDYRQEDLRGTVEDVTGGKGADVILDPVGGDVFEAALGALAWEGRILGLGFTSGHIPRVPVNRLLLRNASAIGVYWNSYMRKAPEALREWYAELCRLYEAGRLRPRIAGVFDLSDAPEALRRIAARNVMGKLILVP